LLFEKHPLGMKNIKKFEGGGERDNE